MSTRSHVALPLVALLVASGCAKKATVHSPSPPKIGSIETGLASWYGHPYHGRRAANGEVYDMEKLTAAHRTLPFGTWAEVLNLKNSRSVTVRITDRGPFIDGRIIDLSRAAARQIAMIGPGVVRVRLKIVEVPRHLAEEEYYAVQVGAFRERQNAERALRRAEDRAGTARLVIRPGEPTMWRVLAGRVLTLPEAQRLAEQIRDDFDAAFVVRLDEIAAGR